MNNVSTRQPIFSVILSHLSVSLFIYLSKCVPRIFVGAIVRNIFPAHCAGVANMFPHDHLFTRCEDISPTLTMGSSSASHKRLPTCYFNSRIQTEGQFKVICCHVSS